MFNITCNVRIHRVHLLEAVLDLKKEGVKLTKRNILNKAKETVRFRAANHGLSEKKMTKNDRLNKSLDCVVDTVFKWEVLSEKARLKAGRERKVGRPKGAKTGINKKKDPGF